MKNRIFTAGELLTIQTNIKEIEKTLGHPIPGGMLDMSDLKDHILRPGEVQTVTQNFRNIDKMHYKKQHINYSNSTNSYGIMSGPIGNALALVLIGLMALPVYGIIKLIEWIASML